MYVKICGTTTPEDAVLAVEAGADALGFIFAPGPRRITPAQAAAMPTPTHVQRVGIFVAPGLDQVLEAIRTAGLHAIQLHDTPPATAARLRPHLPPAFRPKAAAAPDLPAEAPDPRPAPALIGVLHFTAETSEAAFLDALHAAGHTYDAVLLDSRTATAAGGTGRTFDWQAARHALTQAQAPLPRLIVAGGLHPENVAGAIRLLQPWGVDVVTGVELTPGRKDPAKLRTFLQAVRALA